MKKLTQTAATLLLSLIVPIALAAPSRAEDFASLAAVGGRYLIKVRETALLSAAAQDIEAAGFEIQKYLPELRLYIADREPGAADSRAVPPLASSPRIAYVEPNALWHALRMPNDLKYLEQSGLRRLDIEAAWDVSTGSQDVVVAVVDTGIQLDHPDLKNELWINPQGGPDLHGYNFVNGTGDPTDDHKHGTHVAGIIGAEGNNLQGVAGVNWRARLMAVKMLDAQGSGSTDKSVEGVLYAAKHGARVINASWGGGQYSKALQDAIEYANRQGALFLAAAGNESSNTDSTANYPSNYPVAGLLSIASSQGVGSLSSFSNYGVRTVDLAAPGSDILSTLLKGQYGKLSGTSMATPMAAGVAALMLAVNPNLSVIELKNGLLNAVEERSAYAGKISTSGDLNARLAVQQLSGGFQVWPARVSVGKGESFQFSAYAATGQVSWSTEASSVATIDAQGIMSAVSEGTTQVLARDSSGTTVSTRWVKVVPASSGGGGGGCNGMMADPAGETPWAADAGLAMSFGLPLVIGALVRRKRKLGHEHRS